MDEADKEHMMMLNAIKRKDKQRALKLLDGHFKKVKQNLFVTIRGEI